MRTNEELVTILPIIGHSRGENILNGFMGFAYEIKLLLC